MIKEKKIYGCYNCFAKLVPLKKSKSPFYPVICSKCKTINRKIINNCLFCGSKNSEPWGKPVRNFFSVKCKNCNIVYIKNPLLKKVQSLFYENYLKNVHQKKQIKKKQRSIMYKIELNYLISCIKNFKKIKNVLDVGCGGGYFLDLLKKIKKKTFGVEAGRDSFLEAKKKHKMFYGEFNEKLNIKHKFDLIVMRGVIEHVSYPKKYAYYGQKLLKKNGYLFITATPNLDSIAARIFKERWTLHRPESHILHLSEGHVDKLFPRKKFTKVGSKSLYLDTPYENFEQDIKRISKEITSQNKGNNSHQESPPFFGSMMTVVYKKDV